jgi:hypothetical protein
MEQNMRQEMEETKVAKVRMLLLTCDLNCTFFSSLNPLADSIPKLFSSSQFTFLMSRKPFKSWYDDPARILEKYSTA